MQKNVLDLGKVSTKQNHSHRVGVTKFFEQGCLAFAKGMQAGGNQQR
jgi:hypothetical protein